MLSSSLLSSCARSLSGARQASRPPAKPCVACRAATRCWLVGAGPGPAEYLTMRAVALLKDAEVVIYDELGTQDALQYVGPGAELIYVGKRGGRDSIKQDAIDKVLVDQCQTGRKVVRLKGGCPSVFSRVASEMAALRAAGVSYELVPGISSSLAAPLSAGFPLTDVLLSPSFTVLTGHSLDGIDWAALRGRHTLVILMAGRNLPTIAERLVQLSGWAPNTPVSVIRNAMLQQQRAWYSQLDRVAQETEGEALSPCIVVVGEVVKLAADYTEKDA